MSQPASAERLMSGKLWQDFCQRLGTLGSEVLRDDVPGDPLTRAEGYRHLTRMLTYALDLVVEHSDPQRPIFHPHPRLTAKWGGDNPDNLARGGLVMVHPRSAKGVLLQLIEKENKARERAVRE